MVVFRDLKPFLTRMAMDCGMTMTGATNVSGSYSNNSKEEQAAVVWGSPDGLKSEACVRWRDTAASACPPDVGGRPYFR